MKELIVLILCSTVIISSCTKEGPAGPAGKDGVSNISTFTFTTNDSTWTWYPPNSEYYGNVAMSAITQAVYDNGTVQVFLHGATQELWIALPDTHGTDWHDYTYSVGSVEVRYGMIDGSDPGNPGALTYKAVIIPPSERMAHPEIDWTNYEQIAMVFNLRD